MKCERTFCRQKLLWLKMGLIALSLVGGLGLLFALLRGLVFAGPIDPPQGYPKFNVSLKTVSPTLTYPGDVTLAYAVEIVNTGAYTATDVQLMDHLTDAMTYNDDAWASSGTVTVTDQVLTWVGDVDFDASVLLTFTVGLSPEFSGTVANTAVISHPLLISPVSTTAETVVTASPMLVVEKSSSPAKPGPNKVLEYALHVHNQGQPAENLPITVVDHVPVSTTLQDVGLYGAASAANDVVTWTRNVTLALGESTAFTFSVLADDVPPGTAVRNDQYYVDSPETRMMMGQPYTVTIVNPDFRLTKSVVPDPPGANREMSYKIKVLNVGSLATDLVITDRIPSRVIFGEGGVVVDDVVSWTLSSLDTYEDVEFSYSCSISDVMDIPIVNEDYAVCSAEGVCASGSPLTSIVEGPNFEVAAIVEPIAKGPGGGNKTVTPTLIVRNVGPGNALDARAMLYFYHISVSGADFYAEPDVGTLDGPFDCSQGELKCSYFIWEGDLWYGETITFTTYEGQSTIQPVPYTATVVVTDSLMTLVGSLNLMMSTDPVTAVAGGKVTQQAYLLPNKSGPPVAGPGQIITYTINVKNTALATEASPAPYLLESLPTGTTFISASLGGTYRAITVNSLKLRVISWTLPAFGTGEELDEPLWFSVRLDPDLISGTHIVNNSYKTFWSETDGEVTGWISTTGKPVTTTVRDVGLIDSFKVVTPELASPGPGNVFTYVVHVVNSGPVPASGVKVYDQLPWQASTYNRDAVASAGEVLSDIVSMQWVGDIAAYSEELITMTVLVDAAYSGPLTNTAVISHPNLSEPFEVKPAVAYVTDKPELRIEKTPSADSVKVGEDLIYTLKVTNLGQKALDLVITDTVPANVTYEPGDAVVKWTLAALDAGESEIFSFRVTVEEGTTVVNDDYAVSCENGATVWGKPVVTKVLGGAKGIYLPLILRQHP